MSHRSMATFRTRHLRDIAAVMLGMATLGSTCVVWAKSAPDPTGNGPYSTASSEYKLPATIDPDVLPGRFTELWAVLFRPVGASHRRPVVILLHGNHGTCGHGANPRIDDNASYTTSGTCPPGYVITPNHRGYDYLAGRLASWGYVVISINANRGITAGAGVAGDAGLNLARGRLVLKHLQTLSEWNTVGGTPASLGVDLLHRLDLHHVGLMGHSRGGEGMRAAYNLYRDAGSPWPARIRGGLKIDGIFEFAPVDGQTSRTLNADGTTWNVLLPECDGDVSDLEGVKPFDRMLFIAGESPAAWKSTFTVWGANHNFYNTEWQQTDSSGCQLHSPIFNIAATGSPEQRQSGLFGLLAFVRGNIGKFANEAFSRNFNPQFALPPVITSVTRTDRGYSDSPRLVRVIDDFDRPTGQSSNGVPTDVNRVSVTNGTISEHDPVERSGAITWPAGGGSGAPFFETDLIVPGKGVNIRAYKTLNLRLDNQNNATSATSFRVALTAANGALSTPVWINKYVDLRGPVGGPGGIHRMLQTARIPLMDFRHIRLKAVRGVRLIFNGTPSGAIYAANIRLSKINGVEFKHATHEEAENVEVNEITRPSLRVSEQSEKEALVNPERVSQLPAVERPPRVISAGNAIVIRRLNTIDVLSGQAGVEIELVSQEPFPVRNALPVLRIGKQEFLLSRYPESGETTRLIFTLTRQEFDQVSSGDEVSLQYGRGRADTVWTFGRLDK